MVLISQIFADVHIPVRGNIDVDVQHNDDAEIKGHEERDVAKKRKRAHEEDDVHNYILYFSNIPFINCPCGSLHTKCLEIASQTNITYCICRSLW